VINYGKTDVGVVPMQEEAYLTVEDICRMLRVSEQTVWKWIRDGDLRATKFGRAYRISPADFEEFRKNPPQEKRKQPPGESPGKE
jgi:excisionase family DNA binding protein